MIVAGEWIREPRAMAGDRERELVVDVLRDASTRGQLSVTEFDQRWEYLRTARTVGELVPLVSDLPNVPPPAERPVGRRRRMVEPPPEHVTFRTPETASAAPTHPDPPDTPGAAMLPFEDHSWVDPEQAAGAAYDGDRRGVTESPYGSDARLASDASADRSPDPTPPSTNQASGGEPQPRRSSAGSTAPQGSAAEEWNTALRACAGSFALLIVGLLLAVVLG